jgi:hypothetical protein
VLGSPLPLENSFTLIDRKQNEKRGGGCQGLAVDDYSFALGRLEAGTPSTFGQLGFYRRPFLCYGYQKGGTLILLHDCSGKSGVKRRPFYTPFRHMSYLLLPLIGVLTGPVWAQGPVHIVVETVLASQDSQYSDPRLSNLIEELRSVFRYSSYRLLGRKPMNIRMGETDMVSLPGNRVLKITPTKVAENRVELQLVISKDKNQIFQTMVQLLNHGSIIVGGPKHKDGYLLFNISASF